MMVLLEMVKTILVESVAVYLVKYGEDLSGDYAKSEEEKKARALAFCASLRDRG
jgi:hypothetical protein